MDGGSISAGSHMFLNYIFHRRTQFSLVSGRIPILQICFIGVLTNIVNDQFEVKTMHSVGLNSFKRPKDNDVCWHKSISYKISPP